MRERDLSAYRLGKMSGVSQSLISAILRGKRGSTLQVVERIADALEIPSWLLLIHDCRVNGTKEDLEESAAMLQQLQPEQLAEVRDFLRFKKQAIK
jgi:transcriptional regulator with XRE-family HTH domain